MTTEIRFWLDSAGLLAQCIILIYAVFRMYREDWPFAVIYGITSVLSFFSFISPAYSITTQVLIRQGLNTFTVFSFFAFVIYTVRDIPATEGRFKLSLRNVVLALAVFMLTLLGVARITIPFENGKTNAILESVDKKTAKTEKNSEATLKTSRQTQRTVLADSAESAYRTELLEDISDDFQRLVVPLRLELHALRLEVRKIRLQQQKQDFENTKCMQEVLRYLKQQQLGNYPYYQKRTGFIPFDSLNLKAKRTIVHD